MQHLYCDNRDVAKRLLIGRQRRPTCMRINITWMKNQWLHCVRYIPQQKYLKKWIWSGLLGTLRYNFQPLHQPWAPKCTA